MSHFHSYFSAQPDARAPLRLGLLAPLSGLVGLYGPEIVRAAELACAHINQTGGVHGRPLELIVEDDGSLPDTAVPAALRLVQHHRCDALIGSLLSNSRIAIAAQVAEPLQIPYLNFSFYEGSISGRYFFHFAALPNQQIDKMIPFMAERFGPKMYFAGNNYEWPRGSIDAAKRALSALGGEVLGEEYLPMGVEAEQLESLLLRVGSSGADVFVPYFAGSDQIQLLNRFTEMGLKSRLAVVMGHYDELMASQLAPEVRADFYSSNTYFMSVDTEENHRFLRQLALYPGVTGLWPQGNGILTNFGEATVVCVQAFAQAAACADSIDSEEFLAALRQVELIAPQGRVRMCPVIQHAHVNAYLARCDEEGRFTIIESFGCEAPVIPPRYRSQDSVSRLPPNIHSTLAPASIPNLATSASESSIDASLDASLDASAPMNANDPKEAEDALNILAVADVAILATDSTGRITEANYSASLLFGYAESELIGLSVHLLVPPHLRASHVQLVERFLHGEEMGRAMGQRGEVVGYRKDGSFFPAEASITRLHRGEQSILVVTLRDISERKRIEAEMAWRASHDALTGLPNQALIRERLRRALARARKSAHQVAVFFLDLDEFKSVNDNYGHAAGDAILVAVGNRLLALAHSGDLVGRAAVDEFVILCEGVTQPHLVTRFAQHLLTELRQPIIYAGSEIRLSASIGIACGDGYEHDADALLHWADTAMRTVKSKGRDGWRVFNSSLQAEANQRAAILEGLRHALDRNEFSLRLQPIVAANSGHILGAEALLRWHPAGGEIGPGQFVPLAEQNGSIVEIGAWVFAEGCRILAAWQQDWPGSALYLSINLSVRQLIDPYLVERFAGILASTGADPRRLMLEITETALMEDIESNLQVLQSLGDLGLRVAVDDFGTGYSSLAQLTRLPVQALKIDRAFVEGIELSGNKRTLVRAVIGLGRSLQLGLIAEGVETEAQLRELRASGCESVQGYLFYRPLTEADFLVALRAQPPAKLLPSGHRISFLIYVSEACIEFAADSLETLRQEAAPFNAAHAITGLLVYQDGYFMQILEGSQDAVDQLLHKIRADSRHRDLRVIAEGQSRERAFPFWSMEVLDISTSGLDMEFRYAEKQPWSLLHLAGNAQLAYLFLSSFSRNRNWALGGLR